MKRRAMIAVGLGVAVVLTADALIRVALDVVGEALVDLSNAVDDFWKAVGQ